MSSDLTFGVEEEFLVVDAQGHLSYRGAELSESPGLPAEGGELQHELARCQIETATPVCRTAEEVLGHLRDLRARLADKAADLDVRLVPSGTPVLAEDGPPAITPDPRYKRMAEHFAAITDTGSTCGCHVHVAVPDRETGVQVSNHVRPWLPLLLAVTANSPFNDGVNTEYASWRHVLWTRWPSAGPPPLFASVDQYESSVEAMLQSEAILDRGMVYWDIRLSEQHPTCEFRVCDVAGTAEEATLVAVLIRALAARAMQDIADGVPPQGLPSEVLRGNLWRAARDGLGGQCLDVVSGELTPVRLQLEQLIERLRPTLREHDDLEFAEAVSRALINSGGGADRQRAAFAERGRLTDVVDLLTEAAVAQ